MSHPTTTRRPAATVLLALAAMLAGLLAVGGAGPAAANGNEAPGSPSAFERLTVGESTACAIGTSGALRCWGHNDEGRLGLGDTLTRGDQPNEMGANLPAIDLGTGRTATAATAGSDHICAILDNARLKCWGANYLGQLGQGDNDSRGDQPGEMGDALPVISLGTGRTVTAATAGAAHTCALLDNGRVKCWGAGSVLGQGTTNSRGDGPNEMGASLPAIDLGTGRTATVIAAGDNHTCAILDNGALKCWGLNEFGQLGLGDIATRGDGAGEMGNNLASVNLGAGRNAVAVVAGEDHTCALLDNATVKCWGRNTSGQLGLGDTAARGDAAGEMGDNLPVVDLGTGRTATALASGGGHVCALLDNATIKCWGFNSAGQLGLAEGTGTARGDGPGEMGDNLPSVNLGTGRSVSALVAGSSSTCARLDNGALKCWGAGSFGRLGQGDTADRGRLQTSMGDNLPAVFLPPAGFMGGTITETGTGTPLAGINVIALRTSDFATAASGVTDANGNYLMQAPTGTYFLYLAGPAGGHVDGFLGAPTQVSVTDGATTDTDGTMTATRGGFSGFVYDEATGSANRIPGATVLAIGPTGIVASATTATDGTYTITGLPPGAYRAAFVDGVGRRTTEYWDNSPDYAGAAVINVTAGTTTPNISAGLFRP